MTVVQKFPPPPRVLESVSSKRLGWTRLHSLAPRVALRDAAAAIARAAHREPSCFWLPRALATEHFSHHSDCAAPQAATTSVAYGVSTFLNPLERLPECSALVEMLESVDPTRHRIYEQGRWRIVEDAALQNALEQTMRSEKLAHRFWARASGLPSSVTAVSQQLRIHYTKVLELVNCAQLAANDAAVAALLEAEEQKQHYWAISGGELAGLSVLPPTANASGRCWFSQDQLNGAVIKPGETATVLPVQFRSVVVPVCGSFIDGESFELILAVHPLPPDGPLATLTNADLLCEYCSHHRAVVALDDDGTWCCVPCEMMGSVGASTVLPGAFVSAHVLDALSVHVNPIGDDLGLRLLELSRFVHAFSAAQIESIKI